MLQKVFWVLIALTAVMVVLTALGWSVTLPMIALVLVDILVVEEMRRGGMKLITNDLAHTIAARFDSIEKMVTGSRDDILRAMGKEIPTDAPADTQTEEAVIEPEEAVIEPAELAEEPKSEGTPVAGFSVDYGGQ